MKYSKLSNNSAPATIKSLLLMALTIFVISCGEKDSEGVNDEIKYEPEIRVEGFPQLVYVKGSNTPYTGKMFGYLNEKKIMERSFKDGMVDGITTTWHENGQKESEVNYKEDMKDGLMVRWYENGQKESETEYDLHIVNGPSTEWHENGQKRKELVYYLGFTESWKEWNNKGELIDEGGELSEEVLGKKLAEIDSEKETEKSEGAERLLTLSVDGVEVTAKRIIKDFPKFEYFYITSSGAFSLDELRIGKTYASVTGDPLSNDPNIIFSDSFDYLEGEKLLNQDGWFTEGLPRNMSSSAESFNIQKGSLVSGGKKSAGNRLSTESTETISGIGIKIADKASFKNGDNVYLSYLIRPEGTIGDGVYGGYFGVGLKPINQDGIFFGKPGDHEQYGIEKQGGPLFAASDVEPEVNKTSFVVVKIESSYSGKEVRE